MLVYPERLPDETLFSLCARIHRLNGISREDDTSCLLFRKPGLLTHHDLPFGLDAFAHETRAAYGSGAEVLEALTLLPYFTRLHEPERKAMINALARGSASSRMKFALGVVASRTGAFLPLSLCPACVEEDQERTGWSYWRRLHQLPGAFVCERHGHPLMRARKLEGWKRLRTAVLPSDNLVPMAPACHPRKEADHAWLQALASVSRSFLEGGGFVTLEPEVLKHTYRKALSERGLMTKAGNLRITAYLDSVRAHFASVTSIERLQPFFKDAWIRGFLKPLRSGKVTGSPLLHSLMVSWLWGDWEAFRTAYEWQRNLTRVANVNEASCDMSVDDIARRDSLRERIDLLLRSMEAGPRRDQIAAALGWDFKWMQIFDGQWLRSRLPAQSVRREERRGGNYRVNWGQRDQELTQRLHSLRLTHGFEGRQRITRQTVVDRLGGTDFVIRWNRLPMAKQAADEIVHRLRLSK
jgi:hypothetical protein